MSIDQRLALVTPVKNEMNNLPALFKALEDQSMKISLWVIMDDASTDGTSHYLKKTVRSVSNAEKVLLFQLTELPQEYRLGSKYSQIISYGFDRVREYEREQGIQYDFIGILDADCFPDKEYYKNLLKKFSQLPKLGIASGVTYYLKKEGRVFDQMPLRWARGGIRVWRGACLRDAGYMIGNSADAISSAKAWTSDWESQAFTDSVADTREMGERINAEYYGGAAYYLYMPYYYICMKCLLMLIRYGTKQMRVYYRGFQNAKHKKNRIQVNKKVIWYFRLILWRNIYENFVVMKNNRILRQNKP